MHWPYGPGPYGPYPSSGVVYLPMSDNKEVRQRGVLEQLEDIEKQIDGLKRIKQYLKEEDKKDKPDEKKKKEPDIKKFFETLGLLSVFSFPTIYIQLMLLNWVAKLLHG